MIGNKIKSKSGFSLVEILVATALFVVIMTAALNIFKTVIDSQRSAIATQNVEESLKYFLEVTGKEIRMAKRDSAADCGPVNNIYRVGALSSELYFKNYHDECVAYYLTKVDGVNRFTIWRGSGFGYITPATINVDELNFVLRPEGGASNSQPTVTIKMVAHALGKNNAQSEMRIQTTMTSRYYKVD
jgi:prepilin-type N-terminal cleavage/methylation domain-containing protein